MEVKSARPAIKQWYAGLLAYNLIRGVMSWAAATTAGVTVNPLALFFAQTPRLLGHTLRGWQYTGPGERLGLWERLLADVAVTVPPRRRKPRPAEPRRQRPVPRTFPVLRGSRAVARTRITEEQMKS